MVNRDGPRLLRRAGDAKARRDSQAITKSGLSQDSASDTAPKDRQIDVREEQSAGDEPRLAQKSRKRPRELSRRDHATMGRNRTD